MTQLQIDLLAFNLQPSTLNNFVPKSINQISAGWLESALGQHEIHELAFLRIGEEYGFASEIYRLSWQTKGETKSAVAKLWDTKKAGVAEVHFYRLFKTIKCRIPACLYSAIDQESGRGALILEDVSKAEQGDVLKQISLQQALSLAKSLAALHETPLPFEANNPPTWMKIGAAKLVSAEWIQSRREKIIARFPNSFSPHSLNLLNNLETVANEAITELKQGTPVLTHGDFHLDNVLFENGERPVLLDWSRPLLGPPELNLASLIFEMSPLEFSQRIIDSYLEGVTGPKQDTRLMKRLSAALIFKFMQATCGMANWEPSTDRGKQIIKTGIERTGAAVLFWEQKYPDSFSFLFSKK